jgi:putative RNA 2'-phosphotransferase
MKKHSRFMSLLLRHNPEAGNIKLDGEGYAPVSDVLTALRENVGPISRTELDQLVADNDKQRFAFNPHRDKIRASQGHSIAVDLKLEPASPPLLLYHGTKRQFLGSIMAEGLKPGSRQHVHLSQTLDTAIAVAGRRGGESVILAIDTSMVLTPFYQSANGVWLVDAVPRNAFTIRSEE